MPIVKPKLTKAGPQLHCWRCILTLRLKIATNGGSHSQRLGALQWNVTTSTTLTNGRARGAPGYILFAVAPNTTYLVNEHIHRRVNQTFFTAGHRYKSKAHPNVEPFAMPGSCQDRSRAPVFLLGRRSGDFSATSTRPSCTAQNRLLLVFNCFWLQCVFPN